MTTVYVCGPISGYPDGNRPAFRAAADRLEQIGKNPVVPHDIPVIEHEGPCPRSHAAQTTGKHGAACYLRADVIYLLDYCDEIYVLKGWETSVGARLEIQVAAVCGIPLEFEQ